MRKVVILLGLLVTGCVAPSDYCWYRRGTGSADAARELAAVRDAAAVADDAAHPDADSSTYQRLLAARRRSEATQAAMKARGYTLVECDSAGVSSGR